MTTPKYFESSMRSKELLKKAISFIGSHQLSANPVNYTVCYEYLLGNQQPLQDAIDKRIAANQGLTDQLMEKWFETYITGATQASLKKSQTQLIEIISKLNQSTSQVEEDVINFDQILRISEIELKDSVNPLENIVAHLLASTRSMHVSMELMRQQIQESKQEISSLQDRLERATVEAISDPLTGLTNRKGLSSSLEQALLNVEEVEQFPCLLMIDIDHFKKINDTHGHLLGDRVIKAVAETLKNQIKGKDTAARYGGEEFCVLLPETVLHDAIRVAENIRSAVEKTRIKRSSDNQEICRMTISIGVTQYKANETITALFERADTALYRSKNEGRNRVTCIG